MWVKNCESMPQVLMLLQILFETETLISLVLSCNSQCPHQVFSLHLGLFFCPQVHFTNAPIIIALPPSEARIAVDSLKSSSMCHHVYNLVV